MIIGILKEPSSETRVSLLPEHIGVLKKMSVGVIVESNAGEKAQATDEKYREAGAEIDSRGEVLTKADLILSMHLPPASLPERDD